MRKDFKAKAWLTPNPVLIISVYDENHNVDLMNAAWGGVFDYELITITISDFHKTTKSILDKKEFVVSIGTKETVLSCDYVGIESGNKVKEKFEKSKFTSSKASSVDAPIINELPLAFECELVSYEKESGQLIGHIKNMSIDDSILDDKGNIDMSKFNPIVFNPINNTYQTLGDEIAKAFSAGNKLK